MHKTRSFENYHERQIYVSERVIEHAQKALAKIALRDQLTLFHYEADVLDLRAMPATVIDLGSGA